jgi:hypothetical protein
MTEYKHRVEVFFLKSTVRDQLRHIIDSILKMIKNQPLGPMIGLCTVVNLTCKLQLISASVDKILES